MARYIMISGPTPTNAPSNDVAPLKIIRYRAIKTTGTLVVLCTGDPYYVRVHYNVGILTSGIKTQRRLVTLRYSPCDDTSTAATVALKTGGLSPIICKNIFRVFIFPLAIHGAVAVLHLLL
jgi:hypothetical protein